MGVADRGAYGDPQPDTVLKALGLGKVYGGHHALRDFSLEIGTGEFISVVGPSGCGKTTLLKIIAGFEEPTGGTLVIDGRTMSGVPAMSRPTRMLFQSLALFPHKTVAENIGFPLKIKGRTSTEIVQRTQEMMDLMELPSGYLKRYPRMLSGGERQRVALARALVSQPKLLLLDEPLSALDVKLRKSLQAELKRLHRNLGLTFVLVTHDLEEALMLSDRICVMARGAVLQVGSPNEIYYRPANRQVAGFIGETNIFDANVESVSADGILVGCEALAPAPVVLPSGSGSSTLRPGPGFVMLRPEQLDVAHGSGRHGLEVVITETYNHGATVHYESRTTGTATPVTFQRPGAAAASIAPGERLVLSWSPDDAFVFQENTAC